VVRRQPPPACQAEDGERDIEARAKKKNRLIDIRLRISVAAAILNRHRSRAEAIASGWAALIRSGLAREGLCASKL